MSDHLVCCVGERVTLCGAPDNWGEDVPHEICAECLRLEVLDDFCPKSSLGCEAVREGQVAVL